MTATRLDITIEQGADFDTPFFLVDQGGTPVNLTGATAVMQIRTSPSDPAALVTLTTADGSLAVDARAGALVPGLPASLTAALLPGPYVYDVKMLETDGRTSRPFAGVATVSAQITLESPPAPAPSPAPSPSPSPSPSPAPPPTAFPPYILTGVL